VNGPGDFIDAAFGTYTPSSAMTAAIVAKMANVWSGATPAFRVWIAMMSRSPSGMSRWSRYALVLKYLPYCEMSFPAAAITPG